MRLPGFNIVGTDYECCRLSVALRIDNNQFKRRYRSIYRIILLMVWWLQSFIQSLMVEIYGMSGWWPPWLFDGNRPLLNVKLLRPHIFHRPLLVETTVTLSLLLLSVSTLTQQSEPWSETNQTIQPNKQFFRFFTRSKFAWIHHHDRRHDEFLQHNEKLLIIFKPHTL